MDSDFSDFEKQTFETINFESALHDKVLIYKSKYTSTFKFKSYNKWLAYKELNDSFLTNPIYIHLIENEFNIGYELDHPNCITYFNFYRNNTGVYLIKEFVDGLDILTRLSSIKSNKQYFKELYKYISQLIDVLYYLHSKQIYHLDLKPSNILITTKGNNLKLIDFGLSTKDNHDYYASGSKEYASPEQSIQSSIVDARSDIFALGKLIEKLIFNKNRKNIFSILDLIKYRKIITKCTNSDPNQRFQSVSEINQILNKRFPIYLFSILIVIISFSLLNYFWLKPEKQNVNFSKKVIKEISLENHDLKFNKNDKINLSNTNKSSSSDLTDSKYIDKEEVPNSIKFNKNSNLNDEDFVIQLVDSFRVDYVSSLKSKKSRTDSIEAYYRLYNRMIAFAPQEIEKYLIKNQINSDERKQFLSEKFSALKRKMLDKYSLK
jgi:serine/threonine protein kinase